MPEYRKDPFSDRWVIIATERAGRPNDLRHSQHKDQVKCCPFCVGNEIETPDATAVFLDPRSGEWAVRVVPNKYPAVIRDEVEHRNASGIHTTAPAYGAHEVIIESPRHIERLTELSADDLRVVLAAYQDCFRRAARDPKLVYGLIFKNHGILGGASMAHTHSQFVTTSSIPTNVQQELDAAREYCLKGSRCLFCDLLETELDAGIRIVCQSSGFICFAPFASRFPYEVWILPREHSSRFELTPAGQLSELAEFFRNVLVKLDAALEQPAFNFWLHNAPFDSATYDHYHWHIEIIPRITNVAGFEWGTGDFINTVSPEVAAELLRHAS